MRLHSAKKWLIILRAYSWPASLTPVALGSAAAWESPSFSWPDLLLTAAAALLIHSGANLANTYFDFRNGVDKKETADDRGLVDELISPQKMFRLAIAMFATGSAAGMLLALKNDVPSLIWLGAAGIALAWFYTATGFAYKYRSLGDAGIFLAFGPFIVCGTALIQARTFLPTALWASIPLGLLITAILHANNMRDVKSDSGAGFTTLAAALGRRGAERFYYALIFAPYLFSLLFGSLWPASLCVLSLPLAIKLAKMAAKGKLAGLVPETSKLVAVYGLLLSAGLILDRG